MAFADDRVRIDLGEKSYDIYIGQGLIRRADSFAGLETGADALVVSNKRIASEYLEALVSSIRPSFRDVRLVELPDGEAFKTWQTLQLIFDSLLASASDRKTTLFALGGGVVGDMTGFAAACYMRGVSYVQIPTTLLAQVESSVGGKTAINHPLGKNMIGAFHQPSRVIADLDTLDTLPRRELIAGLAEVIKYGPIADAAFLQWIEENAERLLSRDKAALAHAVGTSCRIKSAIVSVDEREAGRRAILNFGHTFGHAIEAGLGYGVWLHGEAIGCGMVLAASLSARLGLIPHDFAMRLERLIARVGLPVSPPKIETARFLELMRLDKKAQGGEMRFVLLEGVGSAGVRPAPLDLVADVIENHRGR
jgi:3-dehydroquinate synthase